jgi:hypothetical protein
MWQGLRLADQRSIPWRIHAITGVYPLKIIFSGTGQRVKQQRDRDAPHRIHLRVCVVCMWCVSVICSVEL